MTMTVQETDYSLDRCVCVVAARCRKTSFRCRSTPDGRDLPDGRGLACLGRGTLYDGVGVCSSCRVAAWTVRELARPLLPSWLLARQRTAASQKHTQRHALRFAFSQRKGSAFAMHRYLKLTCFLCFN